MGHAQQFEDHQEAEPEHVSAPSDEVEAEHGSGERTDQPYVANWLDENSLAHGGGDVDTRTSDAFDDVAGVHADTAKAFPGDGLLAKKPTKTRGPDGYAAWLLEAKALGFVTASEWSEPQLQNLAANKPVRTHEYREVTEKFEEQRKRDTNGKLDNVSRVPNTPKQRDIDIKEAPILETMVAVARTRIEALRTAGSKPRVVLRLGDFMRADLWFVNKYDKSKVSLHEPGTAIDLAFVGKNNGEDDVLQLLRDLPPGKSIDLFSDNNNALHIDRRGNGYGLGVPSAGDYLPAEMAIDSSGLCPAQKRAESEAGDHSRTIEAKGNVLYTGYVYRATATWNGSTWVWTPWAVDSKDRLVDHIKSQKVRDAIKNYGKAGAKP